MDSLDEKSQVLSLDYIREVFQKAEVNGLYIISARTNFYDQLNPSRVNCVITIKPMDDPTVAVYCNSVISKNAIDEKMVQKIKQMVTSYNLFHNPLCLSLFLMTIIKNPLVLQITELNISVLFDSIIKSILIREKKNNRFKVSINDANNVLDEAALQTYSVYETYDTMLSAVKKKFPAIDDEDVENIISTFVAKTSAYGFYRFAHEKFLEYFVARTFYQKIINGLDEHSLLSFSFSIDINEFIGLMFKNRERLVFDKLEATYNSSMLKNHNMFFMFLQHLHRTRQDKKVYAFAKNILETEKDLDERIIAILWHTLLVTGNEADEEVYYNKLVTDPDFSSLHCRVAIAYYYEYNIDYFHYYDGTHEWDNLFRAYKKHYIQSASSPIRVEQYYRVRRTNFFTIRYLISLQKNVKPDVANFFNSIKEQLQMDKTPFGLKVWEEYVKLHNIIQKYAR